MNWRQSLVSSGTFSSSSSARAPPTPIASTMASVMAAAAARRRFGVWSRIGYPPQMTAECTVSPGLLWSRSGRFCGASPDQGLEQQPDHPGNDRHVGKVKNVPIEAEIRCRDVKQHEIGHRSIDETVDRIADRPADDEPGAD